MKLFEKLKHEFLLILPPTIFFLFAFILLVITKRLIQREYGIPLTGFGVAVIGALIVGKVVLIADNLPLMNQFPDKPLLYNIAWKSSIYFLTTFLVRYIEHIIPFLREYGGLWKPIGICSRKSSGPISGSFRYGSRYCSLLIAPCAS